VRYRCESSSLKVKMRARRKRFRMLNQLVKIGLLSLIKAFKLQKLKRNNNLGQSGYSLDGDGIFRLNLKGIFQAVTGQSHLKAWSKVIENGQVLYRFMTPKG